MTQTIKNLGLFLLNAILLTSCSNQSSSSYENTPANGELNNTFVEPKPTIELTPEQKYDQEKEKLISEGWQENYIQNGQLPSCYNFKPKKVTLIII